MNTYLPNALAVTVALLYWLVCGFAWLVPLRWFLRDRGAAFVQAVPFSFSVATLFGYIFYCLGRPGLFVLTYGPVVLAANLVTGWLQYRQRTHHRILLKRSFLKGIAAAAIGGMLLYNRFFDAWQTAAPGTTDTVTQMGFLHDMTTRGYISNSYYAPGFHILLYPLRYLLNDAQLLRYAGPALGVVFLVYLLIAIWPWLRNRGIMTALLAALAAFPVYNQLTLQTIGFFSSALSFYYFLALLLLHSLPRNLSKKWLYGLYTLYALSLAVTVPYLYVQLVPAAIVLFLVYWTLSLRSKEHGSVARQAGVLAVLSIVGLGASLGHLVIQSYLLKRSTGFPEIPLVVQQGGTVALTTNYANQQVDSTQIETADAGSSLLSTTEIADAGPSLLSTIEHQYVEPLLATGKDVMRVKSVRSPTTLLGLGAYGWIVVGLGMLVLGIRRRRTLWITVGVFSGVFGLVSQTGILEMTFYQGRSGWYLMLLSLIGLVLLLDGMYVSTWRRWWYIAIVILVCTECWQPPRYYRPYYTSVFDEVAAIQQSHPGQQLDFVTTYSTVSVLAYNTVHIDGLDTASLTPKSWAGAQYVIIEKHPFRVDPVRAFQLLPGQTDTSGYYARQDVLIQEREQVNAELMHDPGFAQYRLYWQDANVAFYQLQKGASQ